MLHGRATPEKTRRRAGDRPGYRPLGPTGLVVSIVGFGGYRTGRTDPAHRAALRAALAVGVNLIDTSSNYMLGDSEKLVSEVLSEGIVPRDEVVVVSKIGYVQGPNLELAQEREAAGRPFPEMVKYMNGCWHCISPEFLDDQLGRALDRLQLETIDVLLLHNPEYFLSDAAHHPIRSPNDTREMFYDRLRRAFQYLDQAVADGRIGAYGVSSNTCVSPADEPDATSVVDMYAASDGRMAVLQLPYNLLETGALLERNTPDGSALEAARRRGLGVLVNRPLNATGKAPRAGLVRLADPPRPGEPASEPTLLARIEALGRTEEALEKIFSTAWQPSAAAADSGPRVGALLRRRWQAMQTPRDCMSVLRSEVVPEARRGLGSLVAAVGGRPSHDQADRLHQYQLQLNALIDRLQALATAQEPAVAAATRAALEPHVPPEMRPESLSRLALSFVASSPGVTSVLNGMRDPSYVADAVGVMSLPPIPDVVAVAEALEASHHRDHREHRDQ